MFVVAGSNGPHLTIAILPFPFTHLSNIYSTSVSMVSTSGVHECLSCGQLLGNAGALARHAKACRASQQRKLDRLREGPSENVKRGTLPYSIADTS